MRKVRIGPAVIDWDDVSVAVPEEGPPLVYVIILKNGMSLKFSGDDASKARRDVEALQEAEK